MFIVHLKRVITDQNNSFYLHLWNLISKECEQNFKKIYATVRNYHLCPSIYELHDNISCGKHPYSHFDTWFSYMVFSYSKSWFLPITSFPTDLQEITSIINSMK